MPFDVRSDPFGKAWLAGRYFEPSQPRSRYSSLWKETVECMLVWSVMALLVWLMFGSIMTCSKDFRIWCVFFNMVHVNANDATDGSVIKGGDSSA